MKKKGKEVICKRKGCGKTRYATRYELLKGWGKYCSTKCKGLDMIGKMPVNIEQLKKSAGWNKGLKMKPEQVEWMRKYKKEHPIRHWLGKDRPTISGKKHHSWKGGRTEGSNGYLYIAYSTIEKNVLSLLKINHKGGMVFEHHYVWVKNNRKSIPKGFVVHHVDHNKHNNVIENLRLMKAGEHLKYHLKYFKQYGKVNPS